MYLPGMKVSVPRTLVQQVLAQENEQRASGTVSAKAEQEALSALSEAGQAKRSEYLKRARAKLDEASEKRKKARTISYT